jgi:histidyl-tRNA synthetase
MTDAPAPVGSLCQACKAHFDEVKFYLNRPELGFVFQESPRLVRGLDYYTRTVFEITTEGLGAQNAIGAGGRYDGLVKQMGGPEVPAIGFALGMDRVASLLKPREGNRILRVFFAFTGRSSNGAKATVWANVLRDKDRGEKRLGRPVAAILGDGGASLKSQMRKADGWGADVVVICGDEEGDKKKMRLKDMKTGAENDVDYSRDGDDDVWIDSLKILAST